MCRLILDAKHIGRPAPGEGFRYPYTHHKYLAKNMVQRGCATKSLLRRSWEVKLCATPSDIQEAGEMKRIYLDQMAWIELARAKHSKSKDARYIDAYLLAREAVRNGLAQFVLSGTNHYETQRRKNYASRLDIVEIMAELSGFHAMRRPNKIVPAELEIAICDVLNLRPTAHVRPFGVGMDFMWDFQFVDLSAYWSMLDETDCEELGITLRLLELCKSHPSLANDILLTAGRDPKNFPEDGQLIRQLQVLDNSYVERQEKIGSLIKSDPSLRANLDKVLAGAALAEIKRDIISACVRIGVDPVLLLDSFAGDSEKYMAFFRSVKSRWVAYRMELQVQSQIDRKWKTNDLHDVIGLSVAIPYCDIVVTEKQWRHLVRTERLDQEYNTNVIAPAEMRDVFVLL